MVLVDNFFLDSNTAREFVSLLKSVFRNSAVLNEGQNMTASKIQLFCHLSSLPPYHNLKHRVTSDFFKHPFSARAVAQYYFLFFLLFFFPNPINSSRKVLKQKHSAVNKVGLK